MILPENYIEQRLTDQINWYDRKSGSNQRWFKRLRFAEIVAAATIPTLIGSVGYAIAETFRWEIIADNISKAGWRWGCAATVDASGRTIFGADAHRDDGKRFVVHADEKLTAFMELESAL